MAYTREQLIAYTRQAAQKYDVDPDIFQRQIQQESDFNPLALSSEGAQGIAQFMPDTAKGLGLTDPWNPTAALDTAAKYMAYLLQKYGSYQLALAAYNAGEGNVATYGGVPPFPETQKYLRNILGTNAEYPTPGGEQVVTEQQRDPIADALAEAGLDNEEDWGNFGEVAGDIETSLEIARGFVSKAQNALAAAQQARAAIPDGDDQATNARRDAADGDIFMAEQDLKNAREDLNETIDLASKRNSDWYTKDAANQRAWEAKQKDLDRRLKVKLAEDAARNRAKQDETAYTRKVEQDNIDRAIDVYKADLSDKVRSGELSLTAAKTQFDQQMQNYTLRLQRQQMAGGFYNNANELVLQGAGYAAPPGMTHFPGFSDDPKGLLAKLGRMMGVKLDAVPINRIRFDPRGDVERVLQGGYDWAPVQPTVGGTYGNPPAMSYGGTGAGPGGGMGPVGPGASVSPPTPGGNARAGATGTSGAYQPDLTSAFKRVQELGQTGQPVNTVAAQAQRPVMDVSTPVTPQGMDILGMQQQPQVGWDMAGLPPPGSSQIQPPPPAQQMPGAWAPGMNPADYAMPTPRTAVQPARWNPATGDPGGYQMGVAETQWDFDKLRQLHQAGATPSFAPSPPGIRTNNPYELPYESQSAVPTPSVFDRAMANMANAPGAGRDPGQFIANLFQSLSTLPLPGQGNGIPNTFPPTMSLPTAQYGIRTNNPYELPVEQPVYTAGGGGGGGGGGTNVVPSAPPYTASSLYYPLSGTTPTPVPTPEEERAYAARHTRTRAV